MTMRCAMLLIGLVACALGPVRVGRAAVLSYSGDDIAAGTGILTIRCAQGERGLWELDVARLKQGRDVRITRFDDLTDKGDFNYAPGAGNEYSLLAAHERWQAAADSLCELHKAADYYEFSLKEIYSNYTMVAVYRINAATAEGTRLAVKRTFVNIMGRPLLSGSVPGGVMNATLALAVGAFDARRDGGKCTLSPYDDQGRRHHQLPSGEAAIWEVTGNLERSYKKFDPKGCLWGEARVKDSAAAKKLGLTPGRTFRLGSDIVGYYPADNIGRVALDSRATYMDSLQLALTPHEWLGRSREDHNDVGLPADSVATKTFTLDINIAAK
jgi:hypothetical protein